MDNDRRKFLQNSAKLTGLTFASPVILPSNSKASTIAIGSYQRDLGMKLCLAYFWGIEKQKTALSRQMDVRGAVSPIHANLAGLPGEKDNSRNVIKAIKNVWAKESLELRVVEGPPYLGLKTKLALSGRDEEIDLRPKGMELNWPYIQTILRLTIYKVYPESLPRLRLLKKS